MQWLLWIFAVIAGATLPTQAGVNSMLGRRLGLPVQAALASFLIGLMGLVVYVLAMRLRWPSAAELADVPPWMWCGGLLGAVYVVATIVLAPQLGASAMIALIVAGQMAASLALDHFGLVGYAVHPINAWRVLGAGLLIVGVVLIRRF
jgi:transporter family-2 protein